MNFTSLGLKEELVNAVTEMGFTEPTAIQQQAIPELVLGNTDLIGLAQTGTGKTAAFGLPLLHLIDENRKGVQGVILSPTRELALQIAKDLENFSKDLNIKVLAVYGGASIENQLRAIKKGVQIVVATPGRLVDIINRKKIDLSNIRYAVLDEADEMLNMGFKEDLDCILDETPEAKFTWLFSATMPKEVRRIAANYMFEPLEITVGKANSGNQNIEHHYFMVKDRDRYLALKRVLDYYPDVFGLIFCRTKRETGEVAEQLIRDGYSAEALHGDLSQNQRDVVMKKFRNKTIQILVATDVAARGIDVDNVTHVINYKLPEDNESYTHRSGRTGRAGNKGMSIALVSGRERRKIGELERQIKTKFVKSFIPNGKEICEKQLFSLIDKIKSIEVNESEIESYLDAIYEKFGDFSKEDLIKHVVYAEFNRFLKYYEKAQDLNLTERDAKFSENHNHQRLFINLGELDGFDKGGLLRFICDSGKITSRNIGRMDLKRSFSFIEIDKSEVESFMDKMSHVNYEGRDVSVEISKARGESSGRRGGYRRDGGGGRRRDGERRGGYGGGGHKKKYRSKSDSDRSYSRKRR